MTARMDGTPGYQPPGVLQALGLRHRYSHPRMRHGNDHQCHDLVEMASILQEVVIADLFRPWPQVAVGGQSVVLEPRIDADGAAEWAEHGKSFCLVGTLREHL